MPLDAPELDRRVQKLRKSLNGFAKDPTPDEVHDLRTRTRRVESILEALDLNSSRNETKLLRGLKVIRRRSGKVRDMDVLTWDVVGLGLEDDPGCVIRLTHHLGVQRHRHATKLHSEVQQQAPALRKRLQLSRKKVEAAVQQFADTRFDLDHRNGAEAPIHAVSEALRLAQELGGITHLGRDNLHSYRIEVKRLRYILELAETSDKKQEQFIEELKQVQDLIGEWHDWLELTSIAQKVLKHDKNCKLVRKIEQTTKQRFDQALRTTEQMRQQYLQPATKPARHGKSKQRISGPVLVAASEIAA